MRGLPEGGWPEGDYFWWAARLEATREGGVDGGTTRGHVLDLLEVVNRATCSDHEPSRSASWRRLRRAFESALASV